ncbi:MAG: M20/M25/M40 family metallo-hydrolase, partial [Clostridia bacterium]|nr:M20/M25/M40 family metallo-hydrolase [Clostridia bacterium]
MPVLDPKKPHQRYFEAISAIPRASTKEKAVSDYVVSVAREQGLEVRQDELWNVVVKKPATPGLEHAEPVMLQAHLDMVCVKSPESTHNFDTDPLELYVENGHIRARGTTLGADDGYGVAYLLALMEDDDFPHPPLELVFTSQEENGCWGARGLDMSDIRARRMIGLDVMESDRENVCCVSCFCSDKMTLAREVHSVPAEGTALRLTVDGIQPIREGAQVHPELYNAIKLTARVLSDILS